MRLVVSDSENGDVDLSARTVAAEELGRALYLGGSAFGVEASSVDGVRTTLSVANNEIRVTVEGEAPFAFVLGPDDGRKLGASILERPVSYEVECPNCGRRTWGETRVAPSSEVAEAHARTERWTCPHCGKSVPTTDLVGYDDDVWRVPPA